MLVRLLPGQVSDNWELIKHVIKETVPPTFDESPDKINNILEALLIGQMVCWASMRKDGTMEGILITTLLEDKFSKTRNLLVYCIYSFEHKSTEMSWEEGISKLVRVALSMRCTKIVGYTENPSIIRYVEGLGGNTNTFVSIPLFKKYTKGQSEIEEE